LAFFGIDPLTVSTLMVLASTPSPYGDVCAKDLQKSITVTPVMGKVRYDTSKSLKDLQNVSADMRNPHGLHDTFYTFSFARSNIISNVRMDFNYEGMHRRGRSVECVSYKNVDVQIKIDSSITIAKELSDNVCMRDALIKHEQKHISIDREMVDKYAASIGAKIADVLKSDRAVTGPYLKKHSPKSAKEMRHYLQKVIALELKRMNVEREDEHRAFDNSAHYYNVGSECTEFQEEEKKLLFYGVDDD
tara:strand:- start:96 stop:836 length:741 start_codon:yes stop_codon:yes gene_type:complete